jgi:glyoxylase-like metal-dependent hydrolase (beta-lactamase superfamily II)
MPEMKTTQVTDNITQLTRMRFVNAFLVREDDGFTLVDTTTKGGGEQLIAAARAAGGEIRRVAMTHGHGDHIGSADELKGILGDGVEVMVPELDARIHAGEKVVDGKLTGSWPKVKTTPDVRLSAGDRVGSLEVIASPGHSPGHVSFMDTRDRTLIAGDVYTTMGGVAVSSHFFLRFPLAYWATWDRSKDLESAKALRAAEPNTLVVGHGSPIREPAAAMDEAIAGAERAAR